MPTIQRGPTLDALDRDVTKAIKIAIIIMPLPLPDVGWTGSIVHTVD